MTKEKLLEWGLTEEQATKVMEGLNGSFVTKARFNEVNTELTTAKNTIKERDTQLETLKKASGDTKALQDQITQLQADNKKKDTDHAAELKNLKISNAVELALTGAKAKNNTAVKALLVDFIGSRGRCLCAELCHWRFERYHSGHLDNLRGPVPWNRGMDSECVQRRLQQLW